MIFDNCWFAILVNFYIFLVVNLYFFWIMMKKLYLGLLSALFGTIFWLGFVKGDIIDPGIRTPEGYGFWDPVEISTKREAWMVEWYIWDAVIFLLIYFILSAIPLCSVFKKMWEKWWKVNIYYLFKRVWIKELFYWLIYVFLFIRFVLAFLSSLSGPDLLWWCGSDWCYWDNTFTRERLLSAIFGCLVWLYISLLIILSFYRLFRKFGWNKWCSVLWTIFFPIWVCVLWFGNFEYQWENLEKKEWNN